jgi:hypothetical protein
MKKYAFVLLHFGSSLKYFEYELYFVKMLRKWSSPGIDLIYMCIQDDTPNTTPDFFVETMHKYFDKVYIIKSLPHAENYVSHYTHFNTLHTCNFIYGYKLTKYDKVCIVESDMVITENISDIFNLPTPSVLVLNNESKYDSSVGSPINGGIMLFKPSWYSWYTSLASMPGVIQDNAKYPNEELFLRTWKKINPLPERYNYCHYHLSKLTAKDKLPSIVHFNETKWKVLDIIRDKYSNKFPAKVRVVEYFKKNFYYRYVGEIDAILSEARSLGLV